jgi:hypothetical protein
MQEMMPMGNFPCGVASEHRHFNGEVPRQDCGGEEMYVIAEFSELLRILLLRP